MLLAFEVVLFGGLAFMFLCILRNQDAMMQAMREEHAAILETLQKLEKRVATVQQIEASIAVGGFPPRQGEAPFPPDTGWSRAVAKPEPPAVPEEPELLSGPRYDGLSLDPLPSAPVAEETPKSGLPELKF